MPCCKAELNFGWCGGEKTIYTDPCGMEYCLFHAPREHKGMSVQNFNERVSERIRNSPNGEGRNLSDIVFPGCVTAEELANDRRLPPIVFRNAHFHGEADFQDAHFEGEVIFAGAHFHSVSDFVKVHFHGPANFRKVEFRGDTDFRMAEFHEEVRFWEAEFDKDAFFRGAHFHGTINLAKAHFHGEAEFREVKLGAKGGRFLGTRFDGPADFFRAESDGPWIFEPSYGSGTESPRTPLFGEGADFTRASFNGPVEFRQVEFGKKTVFHFCTIVKILHFEKMDFSNVSFLDTDPTLMRFVDCSWPRKRLWMIDRYFPRRNGQYRGRYQLIDEVGQEPSESPETIDRNSDEPSWEKIRILYRKLKLIFDSSRKLL